MPTSDATRKEYVFTPLNESDVDPNPFKQFGKWFDDAVNAGIAEPSAMALATAAKDGAPSARMILLKGFDEQGFVFYTNYESQKGAELTENPHAAMVFYWQSLGRQVRITGAVSRMPREESQEYFRSRPIGAQLGAWVSRQSRVIASRDVLEKRMEELAGHYQDKEIPVPPYWGGYRLVPSVIEFWQGRPNRLHDRLRYTRQGDDWVIERLSP